MSATGDSLHAFRGWLNRHKDRLFAFNVPLFAFTVSLNGSSGPMFMFRAAMIAFTAPSHGVKEPLNASIGAMNASREPLRAFNDRLYGTTGSSSAFIALLFAINVSVNACNAGRNRDRRDSEGEKAGAYGNTPPVKRSYSVVSGVDVEVGDSAISTGGFTGGLVVVARVRPRNG